MQRLTKHYSLNEIEPDLVKEWHPTANGKLTPRNVTIVYPKKVWWICSEGHEWQATIKFRSKGKGCPVCGNDDANSEPYHFKNHSWPKSTTENDVTASKKSNILSEIDASYSFVGNDFRKNRRFKSKATAILEIPLTGHWLYAQMNNFSAAGMYFETEAAIRPGIEICIEFDRPLIISEQKKFNSIIKWCKELDTDNPSFYDYGLGVKFI
jgi:hypothetical protein